MTEPHSSPQGGWIPAAQLLPKVYGRGRGRGEHLQQTRSGRMLEQPWCVVPMSIPALTPTTENGTEVAPTFLADFQTHAFRAGAARHRTAAGRQDR